MRKPHIVFILADDMGYGDVGCFGATKIPTPNMDRLASEGIRFTDCHSSSAVCTPSRYSIITGRYCWRSSLKRWVLGGFGAPLVEPERPTVASMLRDAGYATAAIGKWHLGFDWTRRDGGGTLMDFGAPAWSMDGFDIDFMKPLRGGPTALGFDYYFGISGSLDMPPYCFIENDLTVGIPAREKDRYFNQQRRGVMADGWKDDAVDTTFAERATNFIETHATTKPDQPFFLYLATASPHRPCDVRPDFVIGKSQAGDRGDMVCLFDWVVGQVAGALNRLDIADDTLLVVTSDNGARLTCADGQDYGHKSCGDWRGQKADIWDGGHREPFIARWPGRITPGSTCDQPVCLVDFMATCADAARTDLPEDAAEDSFSFMPSLIGRDPVRPQRETIIHHSGDGVFAIRRGRWKLVRGLGSGGFSEPRHLEPEPGGPKGQLYDMEADPAETINMWQERPDIVEELTEGLQDCIEAGRSR